MVAVLVYLYDNYGALNACPEPDTLSQRLHAAGFEHDEVAAALLWLQGLARVTHDSVQMRPAQASTFRVFADFEVARLGQRAVRFLLFLESAGQLDAVQREIVIERALAIDESPLALATLKVVVLMVLWSQQADINVLLLEELLGDGEAHLLH